ncbi:patatin-like phospholipase family protein [Chitinibacteraceae bacterium HSL-7]
MRHRFEKSLLAVAMLALCSSPVALARERVALVLGGGGARGLAHVGVLKVLEEARIPVDCVVGTSMGALVGGSFAAGRSASDLVQQVDEAPWDDLLTSRLPRQLESYRQKKEDAISMLPFDIGIADNGAVSLPRSVVSTQKIEFFLRDLTFGGTVSNFDNLTIPYRAIATNLENGEMVVMDRGDIVSAMLASMAVPGVFPPTARDGMLLADGGLSRNLGVDVARDACGADATFVVVDVAAPPRSKSELGSVLSVADQYARLMIFQNQKAQLATLTDKDILIRPELDESLTSTAFGRAKDFVAIGEAAARSALPALEHLAVDERAYAGWQLTRAARKPSPKPVTEVELAGLSRVNPAVLREALNITPGEFLNYKEFDERLARVYARGDFSQLDYELLDDGNGHRVRITPVEKSWGPNYLGFGLALETDFDGSNPYTLTARYRRTWLNSLGGELEGLLSIGEDSQAQLAFYQPLQIDGYAFVSPYAGFETGPLRVWNSGERVGEYQTDKTQVGLHLGSTLGRWGELRVGPVAAHYAARLSVGDTVKFQLDQGELNLKLPRQLESWDWGIRFGLFYDQLDNLYFPRNGSYWYLHGYEALGGRDDDSPEDEFVPYGRYGLEWTRAFSKQRLAGHVAVKANYVREGEVPLADVATLGGLLNLSSYGYQQLAVDDFLYTRLAFYHPVPLFGPDDRVSYLGLAFEGAYLFDDALRRDQLAGSVVAYLGIDTLMGPLYLAAAYGDNHTSRYYLSLGRPY